MAEFHFTLSEEEREFLANHLERALKETLVEEHRTRNLSYREGIVQREALLQQILAKLKSSAVGASAV